MILGLIVGIIAKAIMPGTDPGGILVTMLIGIFGAFLGNFIRSAVGYGSGEVNFSSPMDWLFSIGGAILIIYIWRGLIAPRIFPPNK